MNQRLVSVVWIGLADFEAESREPLSTTADL